MFLLTLMQKDCCGMAMDHLRKIDKQRKAENRAVGVDNDAGVEFAIRLRNFAVFERAGGYSHQ